MGYFQNELKRFLRIGILVSFHLVEIAPVSFQFPFIIEIILKIINYQAVNYLKF